jgi:hypothetical protein
LNMVLIVTMVVLFLVVLGIFTTYVEYKKRKLYYPSSVAYRTFLARGVDSVSVGFALYLGLYTLGRGLWLLPGLITLFAGNIYLIFYLLGKEGK